MSIQHKKSICLWQERFLCLILFSVLRSIQNTNHNYFCMSWQTATIFVSADFFSLLWFLLPVFLALSACLSFERFFFFFFPSKIYTHYWGCSLAFFVCGFVVWSFFCFVLNKSVRAWEQTCPNQAKWQFRVTVWSTEGWPNKMVISNISKPQQFKTNRRITLTTTKTHLSKFKISHSLHTKQIFT